MRRSLTSGSPSTRAQTSRCLPSVRASSVISTVEQVLTLADMIAPRYRTLVLLGAFGGLRCGELAGLRRGRIDVLRSRVTVCETAPDIGGKITFGEPKTPKSRRTIPLARSIMREVEKHLGEYVETGPDAQPLQLAMVAP